MKPGIELLKKALRACADAGVVESGWGWTAIFLDGVEFLPEVDQVCISLALPHGTTL